jgi:hypothetical protein
MASARGHKRTHQKRSPGADASFRQHVLIAAQPRTQEGADMADQWMIEYLGEKFQGWAETLMEPGLAGSSVG